MAQIHQNSTSPRPTPLNTKPSPSLVQTALCSAFIFFHHQAAFIAQRCSATVHHPSAYQLPCHSSFVNSVQHLYYPSSQMPVFTIHRPIFSFDSVIPALEKFSNGHFTLNMANSDYHSVPQLQSIHTNACLSSKGELIVNQRELIPLCQEVGFASPQRLLAQRARAIMQPIQA